MDNTILIVDDSSYIVDGLSALLKRKGYNPISANGGDEAVALLKTTTPDLILLDIMMEPVDGWETLERIKADPATKNIPVLMFSAKKITAEEAQDHSLNIEDFISKPVNPAQLLESMKRVFDRRSCVKQESDKAKDEGVESGIIDEYAALRKSIEVDSRLLTVLKNARGMNLPGKEITAEELGSIERLEEKIRNDERRLAEIIDQIPRVC